MSRSLILISIIACVCCLLAYTAALSKSTPTKLTLPVANVYSTLIGTPTVAQISREPFQQPTEEERCDALFHLRGADPSKIYEARVSFAGSPPMKYDMEMIELLPKEKKHKLHEEKQQQQQQQQGRRLLDTERIQFRTSSITTERARIAAVERKAAADSGSSDPFAANELHRQAFVEDHATTSAGGQVLTFRLCEQPHDEDSEKDTFAFDASLALCLKMKSWGMPSYDLQTQLLANPKTAIPVRFVVTVDEMLFGALPVSALPSVVVAVFFVLFALFGILPRVARSF